MRIYRNRYSLHGGESQGFSFHTTEVSANAARGTFLRDNADNMPDCEQKVRDVDLTRESVLALLREWASHPDNG